MTFPEHEIEFTKRGELHERGQVEGLLAGVRGLSDLIVLCHGWNNDMAEARALYGELTRNLARVRGADVVPGLDGRELGVARLFWPSKRFADAQLIPGGGAASATAENDAALEDLLDELARDPERLGGAERDPVAAENVARAKALVPALDSPEARERFLLHLRTILDADEADGEDGSEEFMTQDAGKVFERFEEPATAPVPAGAGGASAMDAGGAAGLGDLLRGTRAAARRIANYATYYRMKARAGKVGRGAAALLSELRREHRDLRLHLVGHSFGGRAMTAAAHALPRDTPHVTLALLQAAFSHNGIAELYDGERDGAFRALVSERRASGPILITHTKNDRAVGIAYPLASRIARQQAAAIGDENDPYGGMGRNGAQRTPEARAGRLLDVGEAYELAAGEVHNLKADTFVKDHGDVAGPEVAQAILAALATT